MGNNRRRHRLAPGWLRLVQARSGHVEPGVGYRCRPHRDGRIFSQGQDRPMFSGYEGRHGRAGLQQESLLGMRKRHMPLGGLLRHVGCGFHRHGLCQRGRPASARRVYIILPPRMRAAGGSLACKRLDEALLLREPLLDHLLLSQREPHRRQQHRVRLVLQQRGLPELLDPGSALGLRGPCRRQRHCLRHHGVCVLPPQQDQRPLEPGSRLPEPRRLDPRVHRLCSPACPSRLHEVWAHLAGILWETFL
mmetsp:Transcript_70210/g.199199  ORF Transcript_70210/g.199199 Transcript_70210/m.199199 type:complete len:249 (+) Transcript_70210:658-1404(+)